MNDIRTFDETTAKGLILVTKMEETISQLNWSKEHYQDDDFIERINSTISVFQLGLPPLGSISKIKKSLVPEYKEPATVLGQRNIEEEK